MEQWRREERLHLAAAKPSSVSIKQLHFVAFNFLNVEWGSKQRAEKGRAKAGNNFYRQSLEN